MRCELGFCISCDKEIVSKETKKPNEFYTEVQVPWSNGARMNMAVCTGCAEEKVWKADKKEMTQAVWDAWAKMGHHADEGIVIV